MGGFGRDMAMLPVACVHAGVQAAARMGGFLRDKAMLPVCVCMWCCEAIEANSAHVAYLVLPLFCCEQVQLLFAHCQFGIAASEWGSMSVMFVGVAIILPIGAPLLD